MKSANDKTSTIGKNCAVILFGALVLVSTVACSSEPKTAKASSRPVKEAAAPVVAQNVVPAAPKLVTVAEKSIPAARPNSEMLTFKSRDYGVSFQYPWQYAFLNAKMVATGDTSLQPKVDGTDGQFTLARVEIPAGYYPDTNFANAYFTLSLNQDLEEDQCYATLGEKDKLQSANVNGVDFRWMELDEGGHGSASNVRNYVAYTNGTCYEIEMGLNTQNDKGLAREVNPDQVMARLDSILNTVILAPEVKKSVEPVQSSAQVQPIAQN